MKIYYYGKYTFEIGKVIIVVSHDGLEHIFLLERGWEKFKEKYNAIQDQKKCETVYQQLQQYFAGERSHFDLPLVIKGTPFQQQVWQALQDIGYGTTKTYGEIAKIIGNPGASRAVGAANRANPIPIIIPCHRVVGSNGKIGGYMGTYTELKQHLLELEQKGSTRIC